MNSTAHNIAVMLQAVALVLALLICDAFLLFIMPPVAAVPVAAIINLLVCARFLKRI